MKINFNEIKEKETVTTFCKVCKKKVRRVISECATVNPYNVDGNGIPKTHAEVSSDVRHRMTIRYADMKLYGVVCGNCENTQHAKA